jgi:hypothetical protein
MKKLRIFLAALVLYSIVLTVGCDWKLTPERLEKFQQQSESIGRYSRQASNIAFGLYEAEIISLELKNQIFDVFIRLDEGGVKFHNFVKAKILEYGENGPPRPVIDEIIKAFREDLLEKFLDALERLKVLKISAELRQTIVGIKTAVLVFADALKIGGETRNAIKEKEALLNG